jgi:hypothetical protein
MFDNKHNRSQTTETKPGTLADIDLQIKSARRKLKTLQAERGRQSYLALERCAAGQPVPGEHGVCFVDARASEIGDNLVARLDQMIASIKRRISELEIERAAVLLNAIDIV